MITLVITYPTSGQSQISLIKKQFKVPNEIRVFSRGQSKQQKQKNEEFKSVSVAWNILNSKQIGFVCQCPDIKATLLLWLFLMHIPVDGCLSSTSMLSTHKHHLHAVSVCRTVIELWNNLFVFGFGNIVADRVHKLQRKREKHNLSHF